MCKSEFCDRRTAIVVCVCVRSCDLLYELSSLKLFENMLIRNPVRLGALHCVGNVQPPCGVHHEPFL